MEKRDKVFIDSNFFIALFHPNDTLHGRANILAPHLIDLYDNLVTSNMVIAETVTVLSQRQGKDIAVEAGNFIKNTLEAELLFVDSGIHAAAWDLFADSPHKNTSFADFTTIVLMKAESISDLLTFDETDFKKLQKRHRFKIVN